MPFYKQRMHLLIWRCLFQRSKFIWILSFAKNNLEEIPCLEEQFAQRSVDPPALEVFKDKLDGALNKPSGRCPLPLQRVWNERIFKVLSNQNHSRILWNLTVVCLAIRIDGLMSALYERSSYFFESVQICTI